MAERKREVPEKFKGRKIYSISRLSSFNTCQHGYWLNYIEKKRGNGNIYSLVGSKVHSLLEDMQFDKKSNEEALDEFRSYMFEVTEMLGYKFVSDKVRENFVLSIEHFLLNYKKINCKSFKSELEFYVEICGVVFVGYIDGTLMNHDGTIEVVDYKTSSKYTKKNLDEHGLQLVLYAIALEQLYCAKINKISWNMLKYCTVTWQGATKPRQGFWLRSELVKSLRSELKKDLRNEGMSEPAIELFLEEAEEKNDMTLFPQAIQDKYEISDGFVEYELSDRTRNLLFDFIKNTVEAIESKNPSNPDEWVAEEINQGNSFFCSQLCDVSPHCETYKEYLKTLENGTNGMISEKFNDSSNDIDQQLKDLFG